MFPESRPYCVSTFLPLLVQDTTIYTIAILHQLHPCSQQRHPSTGQIKFQSLTLRSEEGIKRCAQFAQETRGGGEEEAGDEVHRCNGCNLTDILSSRLVVAVLSCFHLPLGLLLELLPLLLRLRSKSQPGDRHTPRRA